MTNQYHIIDKIPIYETHYGMEKEREELAVALANSGKIRIEDALKGNFARLTNKSGKTAMLSDIELSDPDKFEDTKKLIINILGPNADIESEIKRLKKALEKYSPISPDMMLKIARIFVSSSHPIVIRWLLLEKVEVFIAFSDNIGNMMDMKNWQQNGENSGMQSTNGRDVAIFVACGGDPFMPTNKDHPEYGDGFPALARMQIIAAQEIGHYADIIRDDYGRQIDRFSADFGGNKAKENIRNARLRDLKKCEEFINEMNEIGLSSLIYYQSILKTYKRNKVVGLRKVFFTFRAFIYKLWIRRMAKNNGWYFVHKFLKKDEFSGEILRGMCLDMQFNLAPKADVYAGSTPEQTDAIACIEALARVPQQVIKWGHLATEYFMHDLYHIYYGKVIPHLIEKYEKVTGEKYQRDRNIIKTPISVKLKNKFSKKDDIVISREII